MGRIILAMFCCAVLCLPCVGGALQATELIAGKAADKIADEAYVVKTIEVAYATVERGNTQAFSAPNNVTRQIAGSVASTKMPLLPKTASATVPASFPANSSSKDNALAKQKEEAAKLLRAGKTKEAYAKYAQLLRQAPEDPEVNIGFGRAAIVAGRPSQAVMAYERLIEAFPAEGALYTELAQVYMLLQDPASAENVLQLMAQKVPQQQPEQKQAQQQDKPKRFVAHGAVRVGGMYDSNANQGTAKEEILLGVWQVTIPHSSEQSSYGGFVSTSLDMAWQIKDESPIWLVGDVQTYVRGNTSNELRHSKGRSSLWGRTALGLRHMGKRSLVDVRAKADAFDSELHTQVLSTGPEALFLYSLHPSTHFFVRAGVEKRDYTKDRLHNGLYTNTGGYFRFFLGEKQHEIIVGGKYQWGDANYFRYDFEGWEASLTVSLKLPWNFEIAPFISYGKDLYAAPPTALEVKDREDIRLRTGAGLSYKINDSWRLESSYQYTKNNSTSQLYDYTQHVITVGPAWTF